MFFELFLSIRHIRAKRKQSLISVISFVSIAGITMGIMSLIVVLSVMNGVKSEFLSMILGMQSHISIYINTLSSSDQENIIKKVKSVEGVVNATPSIHKEAMINWAEYAALRGVDPGSISEVLDFAPMIIEGSISSLKTDHEGLPSIILGKDLAFKLGVEPGDDIRVMVPNAMLTPIVRRPSIRKYLVTGIISTGSADYDLVLAVISLEEAQLLYGMGDKITHIEIKVDDPNNSDIIGERIREKIDFEYLVQDWKTRNQNILDALQLDKYGQFIICTMIVLVGALNIISSLVMTVMDKARDIAILRTMGATKKSIMSIFMFQGLFAGVVGTIIGICSGLGLCYIISKYEISLPAGIYPMSTIPVLVDPSDVLVVVFSGLFLSFLATIYPSWRASVLNPIETLRYE